MYLGNQNNSEHEHEPSPMDRRKVLRRHLIYYLRVWDANTQKMLGHIVDITTDGFMLISEEPIENNKAYEFEVKWQAPDGKPINLRFHAESRWSSNDVNSAFYDTGFKLIDASDEVIKPIQELIEAYGFNR